MNAWIQGVFDFRIIRRRLAQYCKLPVSPVPRETALETMQVAGSASNSAYSPRPAEPSKLVNSRRAAGTHQCVGARGFEGAAGRRPTPGPTGIDGADGANTVVTREDLAPRCRHLFLSLAQDLHAIWNSPLPTGD